MSPETTIRIPEYRRVSDLGRRIGDPETIGFVAPSCRRTRPSFVRSSSLLLLTLCVLPSNVFSAQNLSTIDGGLQLSLGILVDTGKHQEN